MRKRISALLLSLVLCLGLVGTAFAAVGDPVITTVTVTDGQVAVEGTGEAGRTYLLCSLAVGNEVERVFNLTVKSDGSFTETYDVPGVKATDTVTVSIPLAGNRYVSKSNTPDATYTITINTGVHGTLNASKTEGITAGESITLTATPDTGYELDTVTVSGGTVTLSGTGNTRTFSMPAANLTLTPVFKSTGPVTITGTSNGTVTFSPANPQPGDTVTLTIDPASGYRLNSITVRDANGNEVNLTKVDDTHYTFTMPSTNVTVTPEFTRTGGGGGGGGGGGSSKSLAIKVPSAEHGKVTVKPDSAVEKLKVTVTVTPDEGYVLDTLTVKDANGKEVTLTKVNDTTYTFLMPETAVTVEATFKAASGETETPASKFSDVADPAYTFYGDIMWAAEKGYMNGYSDGTFRPNNSTTRQALWMVLARIDGANPSAMSAARNWAMSSNISDGTRPEEALSRQQMVTMLYRYAQMKGYKTDGGKDLSTYPDAASVAAYAQEAMSWAVGNGIVTGDSAGRLNPTGTASRAHFAAFLHRFAGIAGL